MYTFDSKYMLTCWAVCQFLKLISSPIRSWDIGILNFILWNSPYCLCINTKYIFILNLEVYIINCNVICRLSYIAKGMICHITDFKYWIIFLLHNKCAEWTHTFATSQCWSVHFRGRGGGVWKSVRFVHSWKCWHLWMTPKYLTESKQ